MLMHYFLIVQNYQQIYWCEHLIMVMVNGYILIHDLTPTLYTETFICYKAQTNITQDEQFQLFQLSPCHNYFVAKADDCSLFFTVNFCPPIVASYINPPRVKVNTFIPFVYSTLFLNPLTLVCSGVNPA